MAKPTKAQPTSGGKPGPGKTTKKKTVNNGVVCRNKLASYKYEIVDTTEAGIVLLGSEVKSLRTGEASLKEAFAIIRKGEVWLVAAFIPPYDHSGQLSHESTRRRKLLLHRRQINKLDEAIKKQSGMTLIPIELHFNDRGFAKVVLALARGKKQYDKRQALKKKDVDLMIKRRMRNA